MLGQKMSANICEPQVSVSGVIDHRRQDLREENGLMTSFFFKFQDDKKLHNYSQFKRSELQNTSVATNRHEICSCTAKHKEVK